MFFHTRSQFWSLRLWLSFLRLPPPSYTREEAKSICQAREDCAPSTAFKRGGEARGTPSGSVSSLTLPIVYNLMSKHALLCFIGVKRYLFVGNLISWSFTLQWVSSQPVTQPPHRRACSLWGCIGSEKRPAPTSPSVLAVRLQRVREAPSPHIAERARCVGA